MKAQELYQELKNKIRRGELSGKFPSIAELCAYYHISHNTVKKALDILKMQQLAYGVPGKGVFVRNFVKQKKNDIKVLVCCDLPALTNPFYLRLLNMLRQQAASEKFSIDLVTDLQSADIASYKLFSLVKGTTAEGILHWAAGFSPEKLLGINLEYCLPENRHIPNCRNDNFAGGYMAMECFYRNGHRDVGIFSIAGELPENIFHHRLQGAEKFAVEHPDMKLTVWNLPAAIARTPEKFIRKKISEFPEKTGLFIFTDYLAMRLMNVLRELGRRVPEDVSVIGYDNAEFSGLLDPALTTIEEDAPAMAEAVCRMIRDRFAGKKTDDVLIKPALVERASVADIN